MELFLIARVADRTVAIPAAEVESVVDIGEITPAPGASPQVRGIAALRSRVVTVISSRYALGAPTGVTKPKRAVLTVVDGHHYAILVNALEDAQPFELQPLSAGLALSERWRAIAIGVVEHEEEPILAIGLRGLVPDAALAA
jgi:purine-binding chemotaxis protein CheW